MSCEHHRRAIELAIHASKTMSVLVEVYNQYGTSLAARGESPNPVFVSLMEKFLDEHTRVLKEHAAYFDREI